jgi:hypothetical protein
VYWPGVKYVTEGLRKKEIVPFPRSHFQEVGAPVERSEKFTTTGAHPESGVAEKFAIGCAMLVKQRMVNTMLTQLAFTRFVMVIGYGFCFYEWAVLQLPHSITELKQKNCVKRGESY